MSGINFNDAQSTRKSHISQVKGASKYKQTTDPLWLGDHEKINTHSDVNNGPTFNGTALTLKELAILWGKFRMHGHFKIEDDPIHQDTIASPLHQLNNNFINQTQCPNNQCDKEFDNALIENDSLMVDILQEKKITDEFSGQLISNNPLYALYNENYRPNIQNSCIYDNQSEFIFNDNQNSFIDISNNKYQCDVESIQSDGYIFP